MAKGAANSAGRGVPNKHLHARISFLSQAATYLALQQNQSPQISHPLQNGMDVETSRPTKGQASGGSVSFERVEDGVALNKSSISSQGLPQLLANNLRAVSLKGQVRLSHRLKRSLCKVCNATLVAGSTSQSRVENGSKGGKKPWADVLVITCKACQAEKRFPVGAQRQIKKSARMSREHQKSDQSDAKARTRVCEIDTT